MRSTSDCRQRCFCYPVMYRGPFVSHEPSLHRKSVANSSSAQFVKGMQGVATPALVPPVKARVMVWFCPGRSQPPYTHRLVLFLFGIESQEHLQGLRTQYRIRVEAMRKQVQQLTARHEVSKKELATSETVGEGEGGGGLRLVLPLALSLRMCCSYTHLASTTLRWALSVFSVVIFIPSFLPQTVLPTPSYADR